MALQKYGRQTRLIQTCAGCSSTAAGAGFHSTPIVRIHDSGKEQKNASRGFRPPPEELGRANSKTCDVTQDLQKERGKKHIKVVKLDPPLSESDRSGFLIDDFDMAFAMFFCEHLQTKRDSMGDSLGGRFASEK